MVLADFYEDYDELGKPILATQHNVSQAIPEKDDIQDEMFHVNEIQGNSFIRNRELLFGKRGNRFFPREKKSSCKGESK